MGDAGFLQFFREMSEVIVANPDDYWRKVRNFPRFLVEKNWNELNRAVPPPMSGEKSAVV